MRRLTDDEFDFLYNQVSVTDREARALAELKAARPLVAAAERLRDFTGWGGTRKEDLELELRDAVDDFREAMR